MDECLQYLYLYHCQPCKYVHSLQYCMVLSVRAKHTHARGASCTCTLSNIPASLTPGRGYRNSTVLSIRIVTPSFFFFFFQDSMRACYGPAEVELANDRLAIQTLLISDTLFRSARH